MAATKVEAAAAPTAVDMEVVKRFKMLADATRLRTLLLLAAGEANVGRLCDALGLGQPAVSHHLALLRHTGCIDGRRDGKNVIYTLTDAGRGMVGAVRAMGG